MEWKINQDQKWGFISAMQCQFKFTPPQINVLHDDFILKEETYDPLKNVKKAIETNQPNLEKYSWQTMNRASSFQ